MRRFSESDIEVQENLFTDPQYIYEQFQDLAYKSQLFDNEPNFYLNDLVKKEDAVFGHEIDFLQQQLQHPTIVECLAVTLKMPYQAVLQTSQTNPIGFQRLIEKAKRIIKRDRAKLRQSLKCKDEPQSNDIKLKIEEQSSDIQPNENAVKEVKVIKCKKRVSKTKETTQEKIEEIEHTKSEGDSEFTTENDKQQKKKVQMIRNRISAQNSRDNKKAYIQQLEMNSGDYEKQNEQLQQKIRDLQMQQDQLQQSNCTLRKQFEDVQSKLLNSSQENSPIKQSFGKIGLTLLTLVSVYMMMGKCQDSESAYDGQSPSSTTWSEQFDMGPHKKIHSTPKVVTNQDEILSQMSVLQKQMISYVNEMGYTDIQEIMIDMENNPVDTILIKPTQIDCAKMDHFNIQS